MRSPRPQLPRRQTSRRLKQLQLTLRQMRKSAVRRAQQAKSLLGELDLDTAIRLRWVMRDIRAKRTKLSPVSENDLAALIDLGFVEMREEAPRLTGSGF